MEQQHLPQEQTGEETWSRIGSEATDLTTSGEYAEHEQPEVVDHLGNVLRRDTRRRLASMVLLPALPIVSLITLQCLLSEEAWIRLCNNPVFVIMTTLLIGIGVPLALLKPSRKARQAAGRLSMLEDVSAIGGLVETLSFGHDREGDAPAREALIRLLPRLKASDTGLLTARHIALLRATLGVSPWRTGDLFTRLSRRMDAHARLQIAILKAFEQVGDNQSLPVVAHLAKNAANPEVRKAAEECLPFVQARVEQERASQTLLRAASADGSDPATLLRPAHGEYEHAPNEMLRPSAAPEPEVEAKSAGPDLFLGWAISTVSDTLQSAGTV